MARKRSHDESLEVESSWHGLPAHIAMVIKQLIVQNCLVHYMDRTKTIAYLHTKHNIDPTYTESVWDELQMQNPDYFQSYATMQKVIAQIVMLNALLAAQKTALMKSSCSNTNGTTTVSDELMNCMEASTSTSHPFPSNQYLNLATSSNLPINGNQSMDYSGSLPSASVVTAEPAYVINDSMHQGMNGIGQHQMDGAIPEMNDMHGADHGIMNDNLLNEMGCLMDDYGLFGIMDGLPLQNQTELDIFQEKGSTTTSEGLNSAQTSTMNDSSPGNQELSATTVGTLPVNGNQSNDQIYDGHVLYTSGTNGARHGMNDNVHYEMDGLMHNAKVGTTDGLPLQATNQTQFDFLDDIEFHSGLIDQWLPDLDELEFALP